MSENKLIKALGSLFIVCFIFGTVFAADEVLKPDLKGDTLRPTAAGAVTNDSNAELRNQRVDPISNRLIVDSVTTEGFDTVFDASADNTAQAIKTSAGNLYSLTVDNANLGAKIYIQLFDALVSNVTVGTTAPNYVIPVPAGAMFDDRFMPPMAFVTAITYAITSTPTGAGAPGATITLSAGIK